MVVAEQHQVANRNGAELHCIVDAIEKREGIRMAKMWGTDKGKNKEREKLKREIMVIKIFCLI